MVRASSRFMCVPFKGFAGNHLLSPTENDGTEQNLSLSAHLGVKNKMEPTSFFNHYVPSPLLHPSFMLEAVTPQNGKNLSVIKHFFEFNDIFLCKILTLALNPQLSEDSFTPS